MERIEAFTTAKVAIKIIIITTYKKANTKGRRETKTSIITPNNNTVCTMHHEIEEYKLIHQNHSKANIFFAAFLNAYTIELCNNLRLLTTLLIPKHITKLTTCFQTF